MADRNAAREAAIITGFFAIITTLLTIFGPDLREVLLGQPGADIEQTTPEEKPDAPAKEPDQSKVEEDEPIKQPPKIGDTGSFVNGGETYTWKIMKDGNKWMTNNLNTVVDGSWCYDNKSANCEKYGRLYNWEAAKEACAQLGDGWRLPTEKEWEALRNEYGGRGKAYPPLIAGGSSGFDARLGGYRNVDGSFLYLGVHGGYWSATEADGGFAFYYFFTRTNEAMYRDNSDQRFAFSVRCLQD